MAALTIPRKTDSLLGGAIPEYYDLPMKAATKVFAGAMVQRDASGHAQPAAATAGLVTFGVAQASVDNSAGSAGAKLVRVAPVPSYFDNSTAGDAITIAQAGSQCFVVDDHTVAKTSDSGARPVAGIVQDVNAAGVLVMFLGMTGDMDVDATARAAAAVADGKAVAAASTANAAVPKASVQTGVSSLDSGTVTVSSANITAASVVFVAREVSTGDDGALSIASQTPGAPGSFIINSADAADGSSVRWLVIA